MTGREAVDVSDLTTWVQIVQGLITIIAILAGGLWAAYVFILGRNTTANVQVDFALKELIKTTHGENVAILSVKLKNTGRTQVFRADCEADVRPVTTLPPNGSSLAPIPLPHISKENRIYVQKWSVFEKLESLQPNEEAVEDILFSWSDSLVFLGESPTFIVEIRFKGEEALTLRGRKLFVGRSTAWPSRGVLHIPASPEQETRGPERS